MLYLLLAIASSALVSLCMRMSERHVRSNMVMFTVNYAACLAMSRFYMGDIRLLAPESGMGWAVALGAVSGFLYLYGFVLLQRSILHNGVILSSAAMKLGGVLIPVVLAVLLFRERMGWMQLAGAVIAVAAVILMNLEKGEVHRGGKKLWLLVLLLISGLTDTMANVYDKTGAAALKNHYLFYTFLAALLTALVMALIKRQRPRPADVLCGLLIGIPNYYSARFLLLALASVPAVVTYPVYSVGTIIVISTVGVLLFKETLSKRKKYALLMILAALVLLNI